MPPVVGTWKIQSRLKGERKREKITKLVNLLVKEEGNFYMADTEAKQRDKQYVDPLIQANIFCPHT